MIRKSLAYDFAWEAQTEAVAIALNQKVVDKFFKGLRPGTLIPSAQRLVWAAKQPLGNAALGALFA